MRRIAPTVMMILVLAWAAPAMGNGTGQSSPGFALLASFGRCAMEGEFLDGRQDQC